MRKVKYDDFIREKMAKYRALFLQLERKRVPKRRLRDEKEREILLKMDRARRDRWIKEGKLEILGPRRYHFKLDGESKS